MSKKALQKAVALTGGQAALARRLNVSQPLVWYWVHKAKVVPIEVVASIEEITDGAVTRADLRPDVFGGTT